MQEVPGAVKDRESQFHQHRAIFERTFFKERVKCAKEKAMLYSKEAESGHRLATIMIQCGNFRCESCRRKMMSRWAGSMQVRMDDLRDGERTFCYSINGKRNWDTLRYWLSRNGENYYCKSNKDRSSFLVLTTGVHPEYRLGAVEILPEDRIAFLWRNFAIQMSRPREISSSRGWKCLGKVKALKKWTPVGKLPSGWKSVIRSVMADAGFQLQGHCTMSGNPCEIFRSPVNFVDWKIIEIYKSIFYLSHEQIRKHQDQQSSVFEARNAVLT